jgi:hypothetical protein
MARKSKLKLSKEGFRLLRQEPGVKRDLIDRAKKVQEAAGGEDEGYILTDLVLEDPRGAVSVMATGKASNSNRRHNVLARALEAARD